MNHRRNYLMLERFNAWATMLVGRTQKEDGQTFVEYALVLSVIVVGVLLAATWLGLTDAIQGAIDDVVDAFGS
jgi:Flp pilus assembly pilin Flp